MAIWDDVIDDRDRQVIEAAGYGARQRLGSRPALLIVDVNYAFVGRERLPILEAIEVSRTSCGEAGWDAVDVMKSLIAAARRAQIPLIYSTGKAITSTSSLGRWSSKNVRTDEDAKAVDANQIVAEIRPEPGDVLIEKAKPSVFFGTELASILIDLGIDSLLVVGGTTSGCVRATVVDAFSLNYRVAVVEEGTFDRSVISHKVSLFDIHAKYANVWSLQESMAYLEGLRAGS